VKKLFLSYQTLIQMHRTRKLIIWIITFLLVIVIAFFIGASIFIKNYKPKFEKILTENIGLETRIDGKISLKVTPGLSFIANDVKVINNETYVFKIEKAEISVNYLKIFQSNIDIKALRLTHPQVYIYRDTTGKFNFEGGSSREEVPNEISNLHQLNLSELSIKQGRILYIDMQYGDTLMVDGINLQSDKVGISGNLDNIEVDKIMFDGTVEMSLFKLNMLKAENLKFKIDGRGGKMAIIPVEKEYFEGKNSGKAILDFTQKPTRIDIQHQITGLNIGMFSDSVMHKPVFKGKLNTKLDISFSSFNWLKAKKSLSGSISISGDKLLMRGIDLDKTLKNFEKSQNFNVVDLTALAMAGPYGAVLTREINFAELMAFNKGDSTMIGKLVSNWRIINGVANSQDVAFSTSKYRLCLTGGLNFTTDSYSDVTISLINRDGCAALSQKIEGPFLNPETKSYRSDGMVTRPIENLWQDLAKPFRSSCTPVYTGSVEHPF
jgi:uncharacterized protein involved in outer membrane biogenesis